MTEPDLSTAVGGRSESEIRSAVRAVILELAPSADESAGEETRLVDGLGYHSLALLELAFTLEDEFDLAPIDEESARRIVTVGDVQDHVLKELRKAAD